MDIPCFYPAVLSSSLSTTEYFPAHLPIPSTLKAKSRQAALWMILPRLHISTHQLDVTVSIHHLISLHGIFRFPSQQHWLWILTLYSIPPTFA